MGAITQLARASRKRRSIGSHLLNAAPPQAFIDKYHATLASVDKYGRQAHLSDAVPLHRLAESRYRVAVEDSLSMARFLVEETGTAVLLLDRPWNRDVSTLDPEVQRLVTRVRTWREIQAHVGDAGRE